MYVLTVCYCYCKKKLIIQKINIPIPFGPEHDKKERRRRVFRNVGKPGRKKNFLNFSRRHLASHDESTQHKMVG